MQVGGAPGQTRIAKLLHVGDARLDGTLPGPGGAVAALDAGVHVVEQVGIGQQRLVGAKDRSLVAAGATLDLFVDAVELFAGGLERLPQVLLFDVKIARLVGDDHAGVLELGQRADRQAR